MTSDIIVIGGGAAGMMAALAAADRGRSVLLLERNAKVGRKLYITGKGRCTSPMTVRYRKSFSMCPAIQNFS